MSSFACKTINPGTGQCVEWVEAFVLPSLSAEQGTEIAGMVVPVLILAAALRILRDFLLKSSSNKEQ